MQHEERTFIDTLERAHKIFKVDWDNIPLKFKMEFLFCINLLSVAICKSH